MSEPNSAKLPDDAPGFQRKLTLFDAVMLIMGTMIGSGIFVVSSEMARDLGCSGWLLAVWVLAGIMTILGALAYAELAAMMPHAGGQYVFLREAYSPMWGFLYGWTCFLVIQTGSIAAVAVAFAKYLGVLVPWLGTDPEKCALFAPIVLNWSLTLPGMAGPFFEMQTFTITSGQLVAVGVIVFLTALNCRGVEEGKFIQNLFTLAKTLALVLLIVIGFALLFRSVAVWRANFADPFDGIAETAKFAEVRKYGIVQWLGGPDYLIALMVAGGAMVGALFSADAWNNVTFTAAEVKEPRRNLPLSLAMGTGFVILLYLLANVAFLAALPINGSKEMAGKMRSFDQRVELNEEREKRSNETVKGEEFLKLNEIDRKKRIEERDRIQLIIAADQEKLSAEREAALKGASAFDRGIALADEDRVATAVVQQVSPNWGVPLMALAIMISTFGCVNGMTLMGARLYYAMARDGLFFNAVGGLNKRGVPAVGLILQGAWSSVLVFSGTYNQLLDYVIFAVLVFYVLTVVGLFILRWRRPDLERPTKAFGYPFLPAIYVFLCAVVMVDLLIVKPTYTWPGLIIVLTGIPVYVLWRIFGRKPQPESASAA